LRNPPSIADILRTLVMLVIDQNQAGVADLHRHIRRENPPVGVMT
jgi:hypothetical protein